MLAQWSGAPPGSTYVPAHQRTAGSCPVRPSEGRCAAASRPVAGRGAAEQASCGARLRRRGGARRRRRRAQHAARRCARRHRHRHHRAAGRGDRRVAAAGFKAVPTGIEHGTVTVVAAGRPFEVTTLREDVETFGRHAKVAFGRRLATRRRAPRFHHQRAVGVARLHSSTITSVGSPTSKRGACGSSAMRQARIAEDYLRILRFFRFHAAYGQARPIRKGARGLSSPDEPASSSCRASASAWSCSSSSSRAKRARGTRGDDGNGSARTGARRRAAARRALPA